MLRLLCLFSIGEYFKANSHRQTPTNKLAVGFRILWKITAMFTLHQQTPTNSISISMFSRVKTNSNQLQPTPTGVTHCLVQRNVCNTLACANERSAHIQNRYLYHAYCIHSSAQDARAYRGREVDTPSLHVGVQSLQFTEFTTMLFNQPWNRKPNTHKDKTSRRFLNIHSVV